jgi:hypothetical protein
MFSRWFSNTPERLRLDAAIKDAEIALSSAKTQEQQERWWLRARRHLEQAQIYLAYGHLHQGWTSLGSANRLMLLDPDNQHTPQMVAIELECETRKKLTGWRADAILALISVKENIPRMRVAHALAIRDSQFETDYFKIVLRRRHLQLLFVALFLVLVSTIVVFHILCKPPFIDIKVIFAVLLFGAMGAMLSVARGLMKTDLSARIPLQKIGSFMIWMRPLIGAAAALISFVLLNAKLVRLSGLEPEDLTAVLAIATLSGFSERFIVGALERIADGTGASGQNTKSGK